jgi:hypothetical protein
MSICTEVVIPFFGGGLKGGEFRKTLGIPN